MNRLPFSFEKPLLALAPMAGVSDKAMRLLASEYGADILFSEMVSAKALTFSNEKTKKLLDTDGEKKPTAIQLFGSEIETVKEGAKIAVELGARWLDFNMGCPVPKVVNNGEGSALLKTPELAFGIMKTLVESVSVPVSVKVRIGFDSYDRGLFSYFIEGLNETGVDLISVHGRTRADYYMGQANWEAIALAVCLSRVPVLANGDVDSKEKAKAILEETGASGVMIGRGALGRPWIFREVKSYLSNEEVTNTPNLAERSEIILRHAKSLIADKGEYIAMREMRKHIGYYVKGLKSAKTLRNEATSLETLSDLETLLKYWQEK